MTSKADEIKLTVVAPSGEVYDTINLLRSDIEGADWKATQAMLRDVLDSAFKWAYAEQPK